ncbi:hypothetical protein B0920_03155 [Massilia sp. KIM]|uniref:CAP domain-containing protein n=1 Tax=Massilia sp. KIM TaxID=1955422 RepID=UPI0009D2D55C|nr:CAP domain-containing protein [Massilia sp. KIM]OON62471.1 hypothetical protein B0920_03155 [Massilia sp. KIM]
MQVATSANYVAGSSEDIAFKKLNAFRASQGLGPVNQDVRIDAAARSHAAYVTMNQSGADPHNEVVGKPGFTGVTVQDRLKAAGYASTRSSEVIAFSLQSSNPDTSAVDNLINSVYHRSAMMIQGLTHVGISGENANSPLYANFGAIKLQNNAGDFVSFYPTNQQTGVWLTHSLESPNPFYQEMDMTQANMCLKTSSPISVVSETSTALTVTSFTVTEDGQAMPLAARLITKSTSTQDTIYLPANEAYLIGKAPFKPNTKYNVRFIGNATGPATGTTNGLIVDKSWSFTTGSYTRSC